MRAQGGEKERESITTQTQSAKLITYYIRVLMSYGANLHALNWCTLSSTEENINM